MAKIVFRLNHVPETEATLVRDLLTEHDIEFYETNAGRWGFSVAAIWLKNDDDFERARALIDDFQQTHSVKMRDEFEQAKREGRIPTFWQLLASNPIAFIMYWVLILGIVAVTLIPIYTFFND
jgi:hypothetical protein